MPTPPKTPRCIFTAKIKPAARANRIAGTHADMLVIHVTAAPERGKANKAVIKTVAKAFGVKAAQVTIQTGQTAALKRIAVDGVSPEQYHDLFARHKKSSSGL